jgi:hypothetical protein
VGIQMGAAKFPFLDRPPGARSPQALLNQTEIKKSL